MRKDIDGDSFMGIRGTLTTLPHYFSSGLYALTAKLNLWLPASWIPQPTSHIPHPTTYILGYVNQSAALGPVSWYFVPVWEIPVFVRPVRSCQQKHRDALTAQYRQKCSWWAVAAVGETGRKIADNLLQLLLFWPFHGEYYPTETDIWLSLILISLNMIVTRMRIIIIIISGP